MEKYYTPHEVAKKLNLTYQQVILRLRKGQIKGHKMGWVWIIYEKDLIDAKH